MSRRASDHGVGAGRAGAGRGSSALQRAARRGEPSGHAAGGEQPRRAARSGEPSRRPAPRGLAAAILALCLSALPAGAEPLGLVRLGFAPARFGAGEEVEAVALLEAGSVEPEAFVLKAGGGLPEPGPGADPELRELRLSKTAGGWELRARFVPWTPGKGLLPPLSVRGLALPGLPYTVDSVLAPGDREPAPPKPQRDPPGTALYLYGFAGLVLVLVLAGFWAAAVLVPGARRLLARRRAAQARRALERSLAYLERGLGSSAPADFYAALARSLRLYLTARLLPEAAALTPAEIGALPAARFPEAGIRDDAAAVLGEADLARFAGLNPGLDAMRAALERSARLAGSAEEALDALL